MTKLALLAAVGVVALAPSFAQAAGAYPQPCCQDTAKLFWLGADTFWKPSDYVTPAPVQYSAPQPCCQDTAKLFWLGVDTWDQYKYDAPKAGRRR